MISCCSRSFLLETARSLRAIVAPLAQHSPPASHGYSPNDDSLSRNSWTARPRSARRWRSSLVFFGAGRWVEAGDARPHVRHLRLAA